VSGLVSTASQAFAGAKTFTSELAASAGVLTTFVRAAGASLVLRSSLGAGASDRCVVVGTSEADGTVNASAKIWVAATGIGGTQVDVASLTRAGLLALPNSWNIDAGATLFIRTGTVATFGFLSSGTIRSAYNFEINPGFGGFLVTQLHTDGRVNQRGTDSSASPGAQTADRPIGKNAIAAAASSVVITNSLVTAASVVLITPHARDATCKEIIAVAAAGSFTVSGSAAATAALPFSWEVKGLL